MSLMKASITMQAACAAKATDSQLCLQDPIGVDIYKLLPEADGYRAMIDGKSNGMFTETIRFRKRFFYETLTMYAGTYSQLIILSCGLDFSSLTHQSWVSKSKFLIDHPASLAMSLPLLKSVHAISSNTRFLAMNLEKNNTFLAIKDTLHESDFNADLPTLVIWEGSTYYLEKEAILTTIQSLSDFIPNVRIIFDYVLSTDTTAPAPHSEPSEVHGLNETLNYIKKNNEPWKTTFSMSELATRLKEMGLGSITSTTDLDIQKSYGMELTGYKLMFGFTDASRVVA